MAMKLQLRRGTAAQWTAANPVLAEGEIGLELDTGRDKFGNGVTAWNALPYRYVYTPPGRRWAFAGDSITNGSSASNFLYSFTSVAIQMCGSLRVRQDSIEAGTSGRNAAQLDAEFDRTIALGAEAIHVQIGTNDANTTSVASFQASIMSIFAKARRAGIALTIGTVFPRSAANGAPSATSRGFTKAVNTWLRLWAPTQGAEVAETYGAIVDPTTGDMLPAYDSGDGIHPNTTGHTRIGQAVARAMLRAMGTKMPHGGLTFAKDTFSLDSDPLNARASVAGNGYFEQPGGTGTAPAYSFLSDTDALADKYALGFFRIPSAAKWAQMDFDGTASGGQRQVGTVPAFTNVAVGDVMALTGVMQVEDVTGTWEADCIAGSASVGLRLADQVGVSITSLVDHMPGLDLGLNAAGNRVWQLGPFYRAATVPIGTTSFLKYIAVSVPTGKRLKVRWSLVDTIDATFAGLTAQLGAAFMVNVDNP